MKINKIKILKCKNCECKFQENQLVTGWIYKYCSKKCRVNHSRSTIRIQKEKIKLRKVKKREIKRESVPVLKKKLDTIFSRYIRLRDCLLTTWTRDRWICITCDEEKDYAQFDAGHFVSRWKMVTRWNKYNVNLQCKACNWFGAWEQYKHWLAIDKKYGKWIANQLIESSKEICILNSVYLNEMISHYEESYKKELEKINKKED
jgi:hypothetical protein